MDSRRVAGAGYAPVAFVMSLFVFGLVGAILYVSSAGSAAFAEQMSESCRAETALTLVVPTPQDRAAVAALGDGVPFLDPPRRSQSTFVYVDNGVATPTRLMLIDIDGAAAEVDPPLEVLDNGEVAVTEINARLLDVAVGTPLPSDAGRLEVVQIVGDVPVSPIPDFWCGWASLLEPDPVTADPPPPWAFASRQMIEELGGVLVEQHRVSADAVTLSQATTVGRSMEAARAQWTDLYGDASGPLPTGRYGDVLQRATSVSNTVARTTTPVVVTASIAALFALGASAFALTRAKRHDLRIAALRGVPPLRIAAAEGRWLVVVLVASSAFGFTAAYAAVRAMGPSPTLEPEVVVRAAIVALGATLVSVVFVAGLIASRADRLVDRSSRRRNATVAVGAGLSAVVLLVVVSYTRLRAEGGVRFFGVQSRGGSLLPMGFPLFAILATAGFGAVAVLAMAPPMARSGHRLPRAVRLGWRRIVVDAAPTAAIVAALIVSSGSVTAAASLVANGRLQLADKADVYVGADLAINAFDEPAVPAAWRDRTSLAYTAGGTIEGRSLDLLGVDPATFSAVARLPGDDSAARLTALLSVLGAAGSSGHVPAIAVSSDAQVGDVIDVPIGTGMKVRVEATVEAFPTQSSGAAMYVVDRAAMSGVIDYYGNLLLVRDPPDDAVEQLRANGTRTGVVRSTGTVFDTSNYSALRWSYVPLAALGVMFVLITLVMQVLVVTARLESRQASYLVMRRSAFSTRSLWIASGVEIGVPTAVSVAVGSIVGLTVSRIATGLLDPLPSLPPPTRFSTPWAILAAIALGVLLWTIALAWAIVRTTRHADPMEVLRGRN